MRYGENSFHELNIFEEVCSWAGVRGGGSGSKADTDGGGAKGGGGGEEWPEEVGEGGGGGSSSIKHAANRASISPVTPTSAATCSEVADDATASPSARCRPSKLHCRDEERRRD